MQGQGGVEAADPDINTNCLARLDRFYPLAGCASRMAAEQASIRMHIGRCALGAFRGHKTQNIRRDGQSQVAPCDDISYIISSVRL